jgi:YHYH protein
MEYKVKVDKVEDKYTNQKQIIMKKNNLIKTVIFGIFVISTALVISCSDDDTTEETTGTLSSAFAEFDTTNTDVYLSGSNVVIKTNGRPNHTSPYWSNTTARTINGMTTAAAATNHPLFINPANETISTTTFDNMAPGNIDNFNGSYTLTVPSSPSKASNSSATGLGAIGIAISGATIYNDEEGPNVPLASAIGSLDYNAAHTGPQSYHYHLEPKSWASDNSKLIGVIADGFLLYGRKCNSVAAGYPTDLDASGGHSSTTQHSTTASYHYHVQNAQYLSTGLYILFPGNYQGTPSRVQ